MWLLLFICISTVCGVPIEPTQEAKGHTPVVVGPINDTHHVGTPAPGAVLLNETLNTTSAASVSDEPLNNTHHPPNVASVVVPLNVTHNATVKAKGKITLKLEPPRMAEAETLQELQEDMVVQEGDILIPEDRNAVESLWSDAVVPYVISAELVHQTANIHAAFRMISDFTCIRFTPRTYHYSYIKIKSGNGCASFVGCRGGAQSLFYSRTCSVGNLCHELIHALGLHHEHTRQDRDNYISVQWQHIIPARTKNFKTKYGNTLNLPYDVGSIMHYGPYFFSADGNPTVLPHQRGVQMGQRTHLSHLDIQRINRLYHCDERMRG